MSKKVVNKVVKEEDKKDEVLTKAPSAITDKARLEALIEVYKKQNPVKAEAKAKEFKAKLAAL